MSDWDAEPTLTDVERVERPLNMSDLTDFLLARIAEDETNARQLDHYERLVIDSDIKPEILAFANSTRVLADVEAKRRIVEDAIHQRQWIDSDPGAGAGGKGRLYCYNDVVAILALPYADHEDYDESWRP